VDTRVAEDSARCLKKKKVIDCQGKKRERAERLKNIAFGLQVGCGKVRNANEPGKRREGGRDWFIATNQIIK